MKDPTVEKIIKEFQSFKDWESRYKYLISLGKLLPSMDESEKVDSNKVKGCQSQVWLFAKEKEDLIYYSADSDAAIVKGIVALLLNIYNGRKPDEILTLDKSFIEEIGLKQHLSMSRANGLSAMLKQIQIYALAYKAKQQVK